MQIKAFVLFLFIFPFTLQAQTVVDLNNNLINYRSLKQVAGKKANDIIILKRTSNSPREITVLSSLNTQKIGAKNPVKKRILIHVHFNFAKTLSVDDYEFFLIKVAQKDLQSHEFSVKGESLTNDRNYEFYSSDWSNGTVSLYISHLL